MSATNNNKKRPATDISYAANLGTYAENQSFTTPNSGASYTALDQAVPATQTDKGNTYGSFLNIGAGLGGSLNGLPNAAKAVSGTQNPSTVGTTAQKSTLPFIIGRDEPKAEKLPHNPNQTITKEKFPVRVDQNLEKMLVDASPENTYQLYTNDIVSNDPSTEEPQKYTSAWEGIESIDSYEDFLRKKKETYETIRDYEYSSAERAREEAERKADVERERSVVDANSSYEQNKASYGANAELMGNMGLSGSGYSDYLNSKAYAQQRAEVQFANAEANATKNDAALIEKQAREKADASYYQNMLANDDTIGAYRKSEEEKAEQEAKEAEEKAESEANYARAAYTELLTAANAGTYSAEQLQQLAKEYGLSEEQTVSLVSAASEYQSKSTTLTNSELNEVYFNFYDMAKSGAYTGEEIRNLATRAGLSEEDVNSLVRVTNDYETSIKYGDPEAGKNIQKDYESGNMSWTEYQSYREQWNSEIDTSADAFLGEDGTIMNKSSAKKQLDAIVNNPLCDLTTKEKLTAVYNEMYTPITKNVKFNNDGGFWIFGSIDTGEDGNNFSVVSSNGTKYRVEYGGVVENQNIKEVAESVDDGQVFGYQEKLYIKKDGKVCLITNRDKSFSDHYTELYNIFFGQNNQSKVEIEINPEDFPPPELDYGYDPNLLFGTL